MYCHSMMIVKITFIGTMSLSFINGGLFLINLYFYDHNCEWYFKENCGGIDKCNSRLWFDFIYSYIMVHISMWNSIFLFLFITWDFSYSFRLKLDSLLFFIYYFYFCIALCYLYFYDSFYFITLIQSFILIIYRIILFIIMILINVVITIIIEIFLQCIKF